MLRLPERDMETVRAALASDDPASLTSGRLYLNGRDVTDSLVEADWGREEGDESSAGPATTLGAVIDESLDLRVGDDVRVDLTVTDPETGEQAVFPYWMGEIVEPTDSLPAEIIAATAGFWLDKMRFATAKDYAGWKPHDAAYDMLTRNFRYDRSRIEVRPGPRAPFRREADYGFTRIDALSDGLSQIREEYDYFFRDTFLNGHKATPDRSPAELGEPIASFVVGEDFEEWEPTETAEGQYSDVLVYRMVDDAVEELASSPVPGSRAPANTPMLIELSDDGTGEFEGQAPDLSTLAWQRCVEAATRAEQGEFRATFVIPWIHMLLEDGDAVAITHSSVRPDRTVVKTYLAELRANSPSLPDKTHELNVLGVIARLEEISPPAILPIPEARSYSPRYYQEAA